MVRLTLQHAEELCDGLAGTRNAILGLWLAIDRAPSNVRDLFRGFDETALQNEAYDLEVADFFRGVPDRAGTRAEKQAVLWALAVRLRALELYLRSISDGGVLRLSTDCLAVFRSDSAYILLKEPRNRVAETKDSFRRRGLRHARLIPTKIGDFDIDLIFVEEPLGRARAERSIPLSLGTGLFEGLKFKTTKIPDGFIIEDAYAPSQLDIIRDQIALASHVECTGVVYPELTIGDATLSSISRSLSDWNCNLSIIVAGSRHHTEENGSRFNVAAVLGGYGQLLAEHRKLYRFNDGSGPHEAIELGTRVPVLVLEQALLAFGICLDFCNLAEEPPYLHLDVDYVLVPSCGGQSTMRSHVKRSSDILARLKSRTLVVQQFYTETPSADDPLGYVLARTAAQEPDVDTLERREPWLVCKL